MFYFIFFSFIFIFTYQFPYYYNDTEKLCKEKNRKEDIYKPQCLNILLINNKDQKEFTKMPLFSKITDNLYLGNEIDAKNYDLLTYYNISYIVNAAKKQLVYYPQKFKYIHLNLSDYSNQDLSKYFYDVLTFMDKAKGNIFVHCHYGKSRSSSYVIAYLMYKNKWSLKKTYKFVKDKRNYINPNKGFKEQLKYLDKYFKKEGYKLKGLKNKNRKKMKKLYSSRDY
jgi:protein-tyrosine phosphatase